MALVELLVVTLVGYRLYVMADRDSIFDAPRAWLEERLGGWFTKMIHCPWCIGWWACGLVTVGATLAHWTSTPWWLLWPAASALVGLMGERT